MIPEPQQTISRNPNRPGESQKRVPLGTIESVKPKMPVFQRPVTMPLESTPWLFMASPSLMLTVTSASFVGGSNCIVAEKL
ncbi:unnamed protein product [Phytophthora fragariaefolia]|uniref:Unnamed protein product n=1 Tax=Phytophthora fragariaefolia TaxID=1490495 RepID=A0A9W6Y334_9STRA|nr:unnamed protein product [Phytophthora fragariaefolia]